MIDSNDLIHKCSADEWRDFSDKIEGIREDELVAAAEYLGANVAEGASWQDYRDAFSEYSWHDATRALEHASGNTDYANL